MYYHDFLNLRYQLDGNHGFKPISMNKNLFDFQSYLVEWALLKGRGAIFADCGLGKGLMLLDWADNVVKKTNKNVLIAAPLAVAYQMVRESEKFGIDISHSKDGKIKNKITITNYERLHYFDPDDFIGMVCDESSAIKNYEGQRQKDITRFMRKMPYRLLTTATAAPNDFVELGTSSEALGQMGRLDMLAQFFKNDDNNSVKPGSDKYGATKHYVHGTWRIKNHAEHDFWRWVCSWARACRKPSDLGFEDNLFKLPELITTEHLIENTKPMDGQLFAVKAKTLTEQKAELRMTLKERCEKIAEIVSNKDVSVMWCDLNDESDLLEQIVTGGVQIKGSDDDDKKEEIFKAFSDGQITKLITKPKIGGFGLNWQHCNHMTFFPSHSFERYYQAVRRCWRFGQKRPVNVDIVTTIGEEGVLKNLQRKSEQADKMFTNLVNFMNTELNFERKKTIHNNNMEFPKWL